MNANSVALGRRERGKVDKRRRISEAARSVFTEYGYAGANMREIAKRAGVATGTLFLYAPDKSNLLLWILNDDLDTITDRTFHVVERTMDGASLVEQLVFIFEARYHYWGTEPDLSLHALQELVGSRESDATAVSHFAHYHRRRGVLLDGITAIVQRQQERGRINAATDAGSIARLALAIYNATIRAWVRDENPDVAEGVAELRLLLGLALEDRIKTSARGVAGTSG